MYAQPARSGAGATAAIHGAGFSLLEVLIALAVLAVGLAGLATLMLSAVGTTADAEHASVAAELVMARVHELRMSPTVEPLALEALAPEAFAAREHAATDSGHVETGLRAGGQASQGRRSARWRFWRD